MKKSRNQKARKFLLQTMKKAGLSDTDIWSYLILPLIGHGTHIPERIALFLKTRERLAKAADIHALHDRNPALLIQIADWADHDNLQSISRQFYKLRGMNIPEEWNVLVVEGVDHRTYSENIAAMALVERAIQFARSLTSKKRRCQKSGGQGEKLRLC